MTSRNNDPRRGRHAGTEGFGQDPRRGSSSPQWNRESQMQHEQFMPGHGHGRQQGGFEGGYGGQGGYEGTGGWRGEDYRDFETGSGARGFSGYGHDDEEDFDQMRRYQPGQREQDEWQSRGMWQRRGQVPNEFSRDDQYRSSAALGRHHDPDYEQWRREQVQRLDEDYEAWRRERYSRFAEDFNSWRAKRAAGSSSSSEVGRDTAGSESKPSTGNKQQG